MGEFENPRRGKQARNLTTNAPKILDLKSSSEQIFSNNCRWGPLTLFESGRESRFDEGEANENGLKSCTVRLSKMSKNYERKFWLAESRRTSGLVGKIVN